MVDLIAADITHIPIIAAEMRPHDVVECEAFGDNPADALRKAFNRSLWSLTAIEDDEPIAMMGVISQNMIEGKGVPWMLGTEAIYNNPRPIVTFGKPVISMMRETFSSLENLVSMDNTRAISFLQHFGWKISQDVYTVGDVQFVRFS